MNRQRNRNDNSYPVGVSVRRSLLLVDSARQRERRL